MLNSKTEIIEVPGPEIKVVPEGIQIGNECITGE
jgi:hypothetical protein